MKNSYWLTRFVLLRLLGLVYLVAFLVAAWQNDALIGEHGLTPASELLQVAHLRGGFWDLPTLFWWGFSDHLLSAVAWSGVVLSAFVLAGFANAIVMALLWMLYMSIVHIGQEWYAFGWEIQLLETGFLGIFLCPLLDPRPFPKFPPPQPIIWLYRWLAFRIMLGSGLIKARGDDCWRNLTCLDYHFETQPIPNPLSPYFHFLPRTMLHFGVLWNHLVELVAPWFAIGPMHGRRVAGLLMISFQVVLILSGNLSFLNWLTIVPCLACLDDAVWGRVLPGRLRKAAAAAADNACTTDPARMTSWAVVALVGLLSTAPVINMISSRQAMNTSFSTLEIVNSYGAFGSVGQTRDEVILEGSDDGQSWKEYQFKCKPGDPDRPPRWISPYHERLDWLMWFAAMGTPQEYPWIYPLIWKLLHNDPATLGLLAGNPFPQAQPRYIRATLYRYRFAPLDSRHWWIREPLRPWLQALSIADLERNFR